jgi:ABC-type branched-subunit amino acid transport system ATPase component
MLVIEGLTKRYATGDLALDDVSLTVPKGQVMALIGPSGAGSPRSSVASIAWSSRPPAGSGSATPTSRAWATLPCAARDGAWG